MKNCTNCKWADWKRTKNGRLHPDGTGQCKFPVKVAVLPMAFWYGFGERAVRVNGGHIDRKRDFSDHCSFFSRHEGTGLVMAQQPPTTGEVMKERDEQSDLKILADAFFQNLEIDNCEYGGIGLDSKRPFGNSDVEGDMLELLGCEMEGDDGSDKCWSSQQRSYVSDLYQNKLIQYLRATWNAPTTSGEQK